MALAELAENHPGEVAVRHPLGPDELAAYIFLDIAVILIVARCMGALFRRLRQPAVVGEIIGGIALGPALLGGIALGGDRTLGTTLFPPEARPFLGILANIGLILFMFIVGLELNLKLIRGNERLAAGISVASVALPFLLGILLARVLYPNHDETGTSSVAFALFIGASMSVTAFPVLARILTERRMHLIPLGVVTLAAAAVDDILAWSLLAVVTAVAEGTDERHLVVMLAESLAFVALMLFVVRPLLRKLTGYYRRAGRLTPTVLAVVLVGVLLSSYITSVIGIHSIFGAFMFGAMMPREDSAAFLQAILQNIEQLSVLLFLPLFFVITGFNVVFQDFGAGSLRELGLILAAACAGKFIGAAGAARLQRLPGRTSAAVGVLMNTRGLTELVILTVGLQKGVLDRQLFTLLVIMALFTTVITEPILRVVYPDRLIDRDIEASDRSAMAEPRAYHVLVAVNDLSRAASMAAVATSLVRGREPAKIVLSHLRRVDPEFRMLELGSGLPTEFARIAESLDVLNRIADSVTSRDIDCVVLERASDDVAQDFATLARTVDAKAVIVDLQEDADDWRRLARSVVEAGNSRLLVAHFPAPDVHDGVCTCTMVGGRSDSAVLDVAIHLAVAWTAPLVLLDGSDSRRSARKVESTAEQLHRAGFAVRTAASTPTSGIRAQIAALSNSTLTSPREDLDLGPDSALIMLVHPGPDDHDVDSALERVLSTGERPRGSDLEI